MCLTVWARGQTPRGTTHWEGNPPATEAHP
jgi:hypothetical protein